MIATITRVLGQSLWRKLGSYEHDDGTVSLYADEHFLRLASAQLSAQGFSTEWLPAVGGIIVRRPA